MSGNRPNRSKTAGQLKTYYVPERQKAQVEGHNNAYNPNHKEVDGEKIGYIGLL